MRNKLPKLSLLGVWGMTDRDWGEAWRHPEVIIIVNEMESIIRQARGTDVLAELAELEPRYEMSSLLIFSTGAVLCSNLTTAGDKIPSPARRKQAQRQQCRLKLEG